MPVNVVPTGCEGDVEGVWAPSALVLGGKRNVIGGSSSSWGLRFKPVEEHVLNFSRLFVGNGDDEFFSNGCRKPASAYNIC
jgi:hypothetical protein